MNNRAFSKIWVLVILLLLIAGVFLAYSWLLSFTIFFYVYSSIVLMTLAQKTQTVPAWIAWIPVVNLYLLSRIAKMHWWPLLLFIYSLGVYILVQEEIIALAPGTLLAILFFGPTLPAFIVFGVFMHIWFWRTFERVGRPGWWILFGPILLWVLLGVAAWSKPPEQKSNLVT